MQPPFETAVYPQIKDTYRTFEYLSAPSMATGFEIVSLVLGLFPIVLEGLGFFISSADAVKEMKRHKRTLDQFRREIKMEKCKFDNTWYALMDRAGMDPNTIGELPWNAAIETKLLSCLPNKDTVNSFVEGCQDLNTILAGLAQGFKKYEQDQEGYRKMLRIVCDFTKGSRKAQIDQIHRLNFNLDKLVQGLPVQTSAPVISTKVDVAKQYKRVRRQATILHGVLRDTFQSPACPCKVPHSANLQLEMRFCGTKKKDIDSEAFLRFHLVFPVPLEEEKAVAVFAWRELELEHLEYSEPEYVPSVLISPPGEIQVCPKPVWTVDSTTKPPGFTGIPTTIGNEGLGSVIQDSTGVHGPVSITTPCSTTDPVGIATPFNVMTKISNKVNGWWQDSISLQLVRSRPPSRSCSPSPMPELSNDRRGAKRKQKQVMFTDLPLQSGQNNMLNCGTLVLEATIESSKITPMRTDQIIQCFCTTIRNTVGAHHCLGVLISKDNRKHRVWDSRQLCSSHKPGRTVSLANLLSLQAPPRKERLKLGVKLASSVMQLHKTEWLRERWSKADIFFIQESYPSPQLVAPILENPLVHRTFVSDNTTPELSVESRLIRCNQSLFSLGIILIELWFWKSMESCQAQDGPAQLESGMTASTVEYLTAVRVIEELYGDAGGGYGDVVRRCITGLDHRETCLEIDEFKNEVYLKVVQPLEEHLQEFWKESLVKIFEKQVPDF